MTKTPTGAILRRDGRRCAVLTRFPAGTLTADELETVARIGRTYGIQLLKITGGQRIALIGIDPEDVSKVIDDPGPLAHPEPAPGVKVVQACLGTGMCRLGNQDSIGLTREIEMRLGGQTFPAKVKIGVSGCPHSCGESHARDIGIMGASTRLDDPVRRQRRPGDRGSGRSSPAISGQGRPPTVCSGWPSTTGLTRTPTIGPPGSWSVSESRRSGPSFFHSFRIYHLRR